MKRLLITRPVHDHITNYFHAYSEEIIQTAQTKGWTVEQAKATRKEIHSRLEAHTPALIVFNGHGNEETIEGEKNQIIADMDSAHLFQNTFVFVRACSCLKRLGPKAIEKGCKAFIGYRGKFALPRIHKYEATPLKDPAAQPVMSVSNVVPIQIINGHTASDAVNAAHAAATKQILRLASSKEEYDLEALKYVIYNDDLLDMEGKKDAKAE